MYRPVVGVGGRGQAAFGIDAAPAGVVTVRCCRFDGVGGGVPGLATRAYPHIAVPPQLEPAAFPFIHWAIRWIPHHTINVKDAECASRSHATEASMTKRGQGRGGVSISTVYSPNRLQASSARLKTVINVQHSTCNMFAQTSLIP